MKLIFEATLKEINDNRKTGSNDLMPMSSKPEITLETLSNYKTELEKKIMEFFGLSKNDVLVVKITE